MLIYTIDGHWGKTFRYMLTNPPFGVEMRQAIEERFILDVLQNYVTYGTYFKLAKKIQDDPASDRAKATKALTRYVSLHPYNIAPKTEIMLEQFRIMTRHKIGGRANIMVVICFRLHAVYYEQFKDALMEYMLYETYEKLNSRV